MTVQEYIVELQKLPPDMIVLTCPDGWNLTEINFINTGYYDKEYQSFIFDKDIQSGDSLKPENGIRGILL